MCEYSEDGTAKRRVLPVKNRFGIMSHEERLSIIMKPFPTFNIIISGIGRANGGPSWSSNTISETYSTGFNHTAIKSRLA